MSAINDIMQQIPMDQLAQELGVDQGTAQQAVSATLPQLLGSMQTNAASPQGEQPLAQALNYHAENGLNLDGGMNLGDVDTEDGDKIANHLLGMGRQQATQQAAQQAGVSDSLIQKLLPMLAPLVMAYIASRIQQQGGFGSILGSVLGGGLGGGSLGGGGLGGVLGGGQQQMPQQSFPQQQQSFPQQQTFPQQGTNGGLQMPMDPNDGQSSGGFGFPQQQDQQQGGGLGGGILSQVLGGILGGR